MTDMEIIKNSIDALSAINVPVAFLETIGVPIYQVRKNLQLLYDAVIQNSQKKKEEATAEEEPRIEEVIE